MLHGAVKLAPPTALARATKHAPVGEAQLAAFEIAKESDIRRAPVRVDMRKAAQVPVDRNVCDGRTKHGADRREEIRAVGGVVPKRGRREPHLREVAVAGRLRRSNVRTCVRQLLRNGASQSLHGGHLISLGPAGPQRREDAQSRPQGHRPQT